MKIGSVLRNAAANGTWTRPPLRLRETILIDHYLQMIIGLALHAEELAKISDPPRLPPAGKIRIAALGPYSVEAPHFAKTDEEIAITEWAKAMIAFLVTAQILRTRYAPTDPTPPRPAA